MSSPGLAQRSTAQGKPKNPPPQNAKPVKPNNNPPKPDKNAEKPAANQATKQAERKEENQARSAMGLPGPWIERLQSMPPQQQERFMQNNDRFRNLPPERQEQIRRRLQRWNTMTPAQQEDFRRRERILEQMTPEQRRYFLEDLGPKFQALPADRRQAIQRRLNAVNGLSEADRNARLSDPNFTSGLNPDEIKMLRELSNIRAGLPGAPGDQPLF